MQGSPDQTVERAAQRVGTVLGSYRLDRLLGAGGMACVYEAVHVRNGNRVAIKVLHPELSRNSGVRERFLREGYLANAVEHPAVVRVLDDGIGDDGALFLVMELLSGEPLEARWARLGRKLGVAETLTLMLELLSVLSAAHAKSILHRDIKIENLFVGADGRLRVLDFGIARQRVIAQTNTLTGDVFGTPWYMPSEQALGTRDVDARSDLWAVGATAFTLLSGRYVHGDGNETVQQALVLASTRSAPPLASVAPHVPDPVATVFDRALAFKREDRWPSAEAMRDALAAAQDEVIRTSMLDPDETDDDVKTRVASSPPVMTAPPIGVAKPGLPLPTLGAANTVGGVAADSGPQLGRRLGRALRDAFARIRVTGVLVAFRELSRRALSTLAVVTASSTIRHRRRAMVAAIAGLGGALAIGTIALVAARAGNAGHLAPTSATGSAPASNVTTPASDTPAGVVSAADEPNATEGESEPADRASAAPTAAPPTSAAPARPTLLPPVRPRRAPKRDPLAP